MNPNTCNPFLTIADAERSNDPVVQEKILGEAIDFLSKNNEPQSAESQYAAGYAWYLRPAATELRNRNVNFYLESALRINPGHKLALLYLGHHLYDQGQFAQALEMFMKLDTHEFLKSDQAWRDAKVAELILCCQLRLGIRENLDQAVSRFCISLSYCEPEMNPSPLELTKTLLKWIA